MSIFLIAAVFFLIDLLVKNFLNASLAYNTPYSLIPHFLSLRLVHNTGIAFGLFQGSGLFLVLLNIVILCFIAFWAFRRRTSLGFLKLFLISMIIGGAMGNLYDRVVLGFVIDYIDLGWWPVFNLADSFITVGCGLFLIASFAESRRQRADSKEQMANSE